MKLWRPVPAKMEGFPEKVRKGGDHFGVVGPPCADIIVMRVTIGIIMQDLKRPLSSKDWLLFFTNCTLLISEKPLDPLLSYSYFSAPCVKDGDCGKRSAKSGHGYDNEMLIFLVCFNTTKLSFMSYVSACAPVKA